MAAVASTFPAGGGCGFGDAIDEKIDGVLDRLGKRFKKEGLPDSFIRGIADYYGRSLPGVQVVQRLPGIAPPDTFAPSSPPSGGRTLHETHQDLEKVVLGDDIRRMAWAIALRFLNDDRFPHLAEADLDDLVQVALIDLWEHREDWERRAKFTTFAWQVMWNRMYDYVTRDWRERERIFTEGAELRTRKPTALRWRVAGGLHGWRRADHRSLPSRQLAPARHGTLMAPHPERDTLRRRVLPG